MILKQSKDADFVPPCNIERRREGSYHREPIAGCKKNSFLTSRDLCAMDEIFISEWEKMRETISRDIICDNGLILTIPRPYEDDDDSWDYDYDWVLYCIDSDCDVRPW